MTTRHADSACKLFEYLLCSLPAFTYVLHHWWATTERPVFKGTMSDGQIPHFEAPDQSWRLSVNK